MRHMASSQRTSRRASGIALALAVVVLAVSLRALPVAAAEPAATTPPAAISAAAIPGAASHGGLLPLGGLFDPSRLTWNQSLTFGVSSGSRWGGTSGLYTSSFNYRLANPLNLRVDIGAQLTSGMRGFGQSQGGVFLQGMSLDWRPSKNSFIRFIYQDRRSPLQWGSDPMDGYYRPSPFVSSPYADPPSMN